MCVQFCDHQVVLLPYHAAASPLSYFSSCSTLVARVTSSKVPAVDMALSSPGLATDGHEEPCCTALNPQGHSGNRDKLLGSRLGNRDVVV